MSTSFYIVKFDLNSSCIDLNSIVSKILSTKNIDKFWFENIFVDYETKTIDGSFYLNKYIRNSYNENMGPSVLDQRITTKCDFSIDFSLKLIIFYGDPNNFPAFKQSLNKSIVEFYRISSLYLNLPNIWRVIYNKFESVNLIKAHVDNFKFSEGIVGKFKPRFDSNNNANLIMNNSKYKISRIDLRILMSDDVLATYTNIGQFSFTGKSRDCSRLLTHLKEIVSNA